MDGKFCGIYGDYFLARNRFKNGNDGNYREYDTEMRKIRNLLKN